MEFRIKDTNFKLQKYSLGYLVYYVYDFQGHEMRKYRGKIVKNNTSGYSYIYKFKVERFDSIKKILDTIS